jgi:hypothetical protein
MALSDLIAMQGSLSAAPGMPADTAMTAEARRRG